MPRSLPEDPLIRRLVQQARRAQLTRRSMLARDAAAPRGARTRRVRARPDRRQAEPAEDLSDTDKTLIWATGPATSTRTRTATTRPSTRFIEQTGIEVDYRVDIDDNNSYYAKVKDQLALGQDIGADLVALTDWMVSRLIRFGYTQELDHRQHPEHREPRPRPAEHRLRRGSQAVAPWQGGFAGICWNKEKVPDGLRTRRRPLEPGAQGPRSSC